MRIAHYYEAESNIKTKLYKITISNLPNGEIKPCLNITS